MQRLLPISVVISILMVSRIPYPHPLTQFVRGQRTFAQLVAIVFSLMAILIAWRYAIPLLCACSASAAPVEFAWDTLRHRRREESLF